MTNISASKKLIGSITLLIIVLIAGGVRWWMQKSTSSLPSQNNGTNSGQQVTQTGSVSGSDTISGAQPVTGDGAAGDGVTISGGQDDGQGADTADQGVGVQGGDVAESDALKDPDVQEVLKLFEDLTK